MSTSQVSPEVLRPVDASGTRPRLAIIISHPIQHFCPMYRELAAQGAVELLVIFAESGAEPRYDPDFLIVTKWQDNLLEGVPHVVLKVAPGDRPKAVLDELKRFDPQVIYLHGYNLPYLREAMDWARRNNVGVMMSTDSELRGPRPWHIKLAKRFILPLIFRKIDLFLTVGDANEEYFAYYGVDRAKFVRAPFSIDSDDYDRALARRTEVRTTLRETLGLSPETIVLLNVGKLTPIKSQDYLMRAFTKARELTGIDCVLLIAGDGPERKRLEELAATSAGGIRLLGFVGVNDLPAHYLTADIYVHPSLFDPHPLAVSEAIYCSLPLVASDRIGSTGPTDDLQPGKNGWVHPYGDEQTLTDILVMLLQDADLRSRAGAISGQLGKVHAAGHVARCFSQGALRVAAQSKQVESQ